jgi:hypothetical protein
MVDCVMPIITHTVAVVLVVASVALAAGSHEKSLAEERFEGTVTRVDSRGGATIKTTEGREYPVQAIGLQVGDKIACGRHGDGRCEKITEKTK